MEDRGFASIEAGDSIINRYPTVAGKSASNIYPLLRRDFEMDADRSEAAGFSLTAAVSNGSKSLEQIMRDDHHSCPDCPDIFVETTSFNCVRQFFNNGGIDAWRKKKSPCPLCSTTEIATSTSHWHYYSDSDDGFVESLKPNDFPLGEEDHLQKSNSKCSSIDEVPPVRSRVFSSSLPEWICGTESRFCLDSPLTLVLPWDSNTVYCPLTGETHFKIESRRWSLRCKKLIVDPCATPVANLKKVQFSFSNKFVIYAGDSSEMKLCSCTASRNWVKAKLTAKFTDAVTGNPRRVVMKGMDWKNRTCLIYLGEPKRAGIPLAEIKRSTEGYCLQIAAGMDVALVVILCIALNEHLED